MHGAFFDVIVFSNDAKIREISKYRMKQSMDLAKKLRVKGVVFHTNSNPQVPGEFYERQVVERTVSYLEELLNQYPDISIYLENMFDRKPDLLVRISEQLKKYENYNSIDFLDEMRSLLTKYKMYVEYIDIFISCEKPKLSDYTQIMKANIANKLNIEPSRVSIKCGTNEKLGYVGKMKGIECFSTVLLMEEKDKHE